MLVETDGKKKAGKSKPLIVEDYALNEALNALRALTILKPATVAVQEKSATETK